MNRQLLNFVPLLLLYLLVVIFFAKSDIIGDESRYLRYAENLTKGYYVDPANPVITNGPGYPLFLAPLIALGLPYWLIKSFNILFVFGAVWYMFKTLKLYISEKRALLFAYLFGLYPTLVKWMPKLYTEALAVFLLSGLIYHAIEYMGSQKKNSRHLLYAGFFLGYLALTKYIFIYLIVGLLVFLAVVNLFRPRPKYRLFSHILLIGFLLYVPNIIHNIVATKQLIISGQNGAELLYWRSTPFPEEAGNWISFDVVLEKERIANLEAWAITEIQTKHLAFIQEVYDLPLEERNKRLTKKAMENIAENPINYIRNSAASFLRLFFNFPYSYTTQKIQSFFYILPGSFLFVFTSLGVFIALIRYKTLPEELIVFILIGLLYIGEMTILNGNARNLLTISPILFLFNAYIWNCVVQVKFTKQAVVS